MLIGRMSSRSLDDLSPATRACALEFLARTRAAGFDVLVTCTLRSSQDQAELYAQGRTRPGPIVTWAKPGESRHEDGTALDVVPLRSGKCVWGTAGADGELWRAIGGLGEKSGLEWAGRWPAKRREYPHFQYKGKS